MKIKEEHIVQETPHGDILEYDIRYIKKNIFSPWKIEMDGQVPMMYNIKIAIAEYAHIIDFPIGAEYRQDGKFYICKEKVDGEGCSHCALFVDDDCIKSRRINCFKEFRADRKDIKFVRNE